jgi:hypothetical protein
MLRVGVRPLGDGADGDGEGTAGAGAGRASAVSVDSSRSSSTGAGAFPLSAGASFLVELERKRALRDGICAKSRKKCVGLEIVFAW